MYHIKIGFYQALSLDISIVLYVIIFFWGYEGIPFIFMRSVVSNPAIQGVAAGLLILRKTSCLDVYF